MGIKGRCSDVARTLKRDREFFLSQQAGSFASLRFHSFEVQPLVHIGFILFP
jgi:hypothetical protein